ncbi:MAG TPA: hypothetical protein VK034_16135 [Enhygromyxa sp.]|nr:hypothetical protein [Enhygromyxa sp.]
MPSPARPHALFGLLALGMIACTGPPAEVVIETRVGDQQARRDGEAAREAAVTIARAAHDWWQEQSLRQVVAPIEPDVDPERADADQPGTDAPATELRYQPSPPREREQFEAQVEALREGPLDEVGLITRTLAQAGPQLWPEIRELLLAERQRSKREYVQVLAVIGGDVPNRYGHFDLHWKRAHGYDVRLSEDWFEDLLGVEPGRISKPLRPVYRDALLTVALLRAASNVARSEPRLVGEITAVLLDAAYVHDGTFRDEVGRAIDALGNPAIPHLMRESTTGQAAKQDSVEARRAAYARYCLDRMDRLHPSRAVAAVADDRRLLADTLAAFALTREGEAASLLLDWVDADAPGVRQAARESFESYVTGPAPQVRRKSIRLFNGQTSTQRAELSYREHARLAIRDRLVEHAPDLLEPECQLWLAGGLIDPECERQPERLFRAWLARLDERRLARRDSTVVAALAHRDPAAGAAMLDTLLTDGSDPIEPDLIAPFYVEVASEAEARGDRARAAQLLRKSAILLADVEPDRARELTVDALMLEAQAEQVDAAGRAMLLGTARDLDPDSAIVGQAIAALDDQRGQSSAALRERLGWTVLAMFAGLGVVSLIAGRIHRPKVALQA